MRRFIALTVLLTLIPAAAMAQEFTQDDNSASMRLGNDLYAAGNILTIMESVEDDLFIAGNRIAIRSTIGGDVHAAGSTITIDGTVKDDLRVVGGDVTISGTIEGDVLMAGGTIYLEPTAVIKGNLLGGGGTIRVEGTVEGNVKISGGDIAYLGTTIGTLEMQGETVTMNGIVQGDAAVAGQTLSIDPATTIGSNLHYWSNAGAVAIKANVTGEIVLDEALKMPERVRAQQSENKGIAAGILGAFSIIALLAAALSIGVFQFATKKFFIDSAQKLRTMPGMSLLFGLIFFVLTPIVILLLMITIIGFPIALAVGAAYFISVLFAQILAALVLARAAEQTWAKKKTKWHPTAIYFAALGIWMLFKILWFMPVLGWIIVVLTVTAAYGALLTIKWERFKQVA